jgi:hypothetical protein
VDLLVRGGSTPLRRTANRLHPSVYRERASHLPRTRPRPGYQAGAKLCADGRAVAARRASLARRRRLAGSRLLLPVGDPRRYSGAAFRGHRRLPDAVRSGATPHPTTEACCSRSTCFRKAPHRVAEPIGPIWDVNPHRDAVRYQLVRVGRANAKQELDTDPWKGRQQPRQ